MESAFLDELAKAGISPTHSLLFDGQLRRFNVEGDKKGRRNGWYRFVRVRDDFAWGVYGCNRRNISGKWSSIKKSEYTAYDKKTVKLKQEEFKKEELATQTKIAAKARHMWEWLKTPLEHPYAARKQISLYNVRQLNGALVVPAYNESGLVSFQTITADGEKRFLVGGQMKGSFAPIGSETDVMYIMEGYATGMTIWATTGKMVVLAFFASNIVPVAIAMRAKFPNKKIVIAADNDQWTSGNPGMSYAREAADKIGAAVVFPKFSNEDKDRPTDWNDWYLRYGADSLCSEITGEKKAIATVDPEKAWRRKLMEGKSMLPGYPDFEGGSKQNCFLFMKNHEKFSKIFAFNEFTNKTMIMICPPWQEEASFIPRDLLDCDASMVVKELEILGINTNKDTVWDYIAFLSLQNSINPPRDYFNSLVWDGKERIDKWLITYLGAGAKQAYGYLELVGSKWLMAIVARSFNPGCKFDNVLVLEGGQGIKKTSAFETLATFHDENYFLEFGGDVTNKDSLELMQGKIIVEMSELASIRRSEIEDMKLFISRRIDEYRKSYGREPIKRPRFFVLGGSTNKVGQEYLEDETGARRIWPVQCGENINLEGLRRDREQLYAEAVVRVRAGERIWLEGLETEMARFEQSDRQLEDSWEFKIEDYLIGISETTASAVMSNIGLQTKEMNNFTLRRVKNIMIKLGWKEFKPSRQDRGRKWKKI